MGAQAVFKSSWGVKESTSCVQEFMGALSRAQAVFKSSWGRSGEHKHGGR